MLSAILAACPIGLAQTAAEQIQSITSALRAGQFDNALQLLEPELSQAPKNPQLWTLRGIALSGKGDKKEALSAFLRALNVSPDYLPALEGAAQIEYENGGKDAAGLLEHVLRLQPNDPTSHAMLAVLAYRHRNCAEAVVHFELSGSLIDSQAGALKEYGDCLVRLKQNEKAIAVFTRALSQGDDTGVRYRLASLQLLAQRPKDAVATLEPELQKNTSDSEVLDLAASAYEADGNTPEAVRILRQAIVSNPHNVNLYVDFANLSMDHRSFQVGIDMVDAGIRAEPKAAPLFVARGILYAQMALYDQAEKDFARADALDPGRAIGSAAEGLTAEQMHDPDRALATVRAKLAKMPNDAFLLYLQADILAQKGPAPGSAGFREAMASAKKAIALQSSLASARSLLAKLYLQAGETKLAIQECRQTLKINPDDQTALYHLIMALRNSGQENEIPPLLKRLADLRQQTTEKEAERNRYQLIEEKSPATEKPQ
jgi:tetratricopeptide (TPR) repeat protein